MVEKKDGKKWLDRIDKTIEQVMQENGYDSYEEGISSIVREFNSRISIGLFSKIDGKCLKKVTAVSTRDFWILNFYIEIDQEDENGLMGYGYAYNLEDERLSEWGNLYTP